MAVHENRAACTAASHRGRGHLPRTRRDSTSALYRGTFSRRRSDGGEISRLTATYLVTVAAVGRRISVLVVHSP